MRQQNQLPLSKEVQDWILQATDPAADILSISPMPGGMSSHIYHVKVRHADENRNYVIRQVDDKEWLDEEPHLALHEMESLRWMMPAPIPTPVPIASDPDGEICGYPTVLMSKLEGKVVLKPDCMETWLSGLAYTLTCIHTMKPDGFQWEYVTYQNLNTLRHPEWSTLSNQWKKVFSIVTGPQPAVKESFIHRDYHPANVLWDGKEISGVVDWVNACRGPAGIDVGHCRVDLAQLYGVEAADRFLDYYLKYAESSFQYEPYWDLLSLVDILFGTPAVYPGWTALGFTGLTNEIIAKRIELYMQSLVERL